MNYDVLNISNLDESNGNNAKVESIGDNEIHDHFKYSRYSRMWFSKYVAIMLQNDDEKKKTASIIQTST